MVTADDFFWWWVERQTGVSEDAVRNDPTVQRIVNEEADRWTPEVFDRVLAELRRRESSSSADRQEQTAGGSVLAAALGRVEKQVDALLSSDGKMATKFLSIKAACRYTGLSYSHLRRAVLSGDLRASNVGSKARPTYRIDRQALDEWVAKREGGMLLPPSVPTVRTAKTSRHFAGPSR